MDKELTMSPIMTRNEPDSARFAPVDLDSLYTRKKQMFVYAEKTSWWSLYCIAWQWLSATLSYF